MKTADVWIGYTGEDRKRFATWSGGVLGKVTSYVTEERVRSTPSGGQYRMRHVTVQPWMQSQAQLRGKVQ